MGNELRVLDLFSAAAGGWSLGLHRAGFKTVAACESVAWRRALYSQNNPGVLIYDDVCTLTADRLVRDLGYLPDVVVGSPPCQDISSANTKGKGVEGERSGLYFEAIRIIGEVRPRWFALENSSNLRTRGADAVLAALEALSYACWSYVVRARDVGANHERPRSWLIGCDLSQVADASGWEQREQPRWRNGAGWSGSPLDSLYDQEFAADSHGIGWDAGRQGRRALATEGLPVEACGDATGTPAHADQAGQADGCMVPGLRQAEIALDGRGAGRRDDGQSDGQVDWSSGAGLDAPEPWADWNSGLAGHLRVDDGLSAWVAGTRIAVGGPLGTSAASLIVEAFGDAVVPQIPEAIGRAILRTEQALAAVYGSAAA